MSVLSPYTANRIAKFYDGLTPDQRMLSKLLAAFTSEVSMTSFVKLIRRASFRREDGQPFESADVRPLFEAINKAEYGYFQPSKPFLPIRSFVAGIAEIVSETERLSEYALRLQDAHESPHYGSYVQSSDRIERLGHAYYWDADTAMLEEILLHGRYLQRVNVDKLEFANYPFDARRFHCIPEVYHAELVPKIHESLTWDMFYLPEWIGFLRNSKDVRALALLGDALLVAGDLKGADEIADRLRASKSKVRKVAGYFLKGVVAFLRGAEEESQTMVQQGLELKAGAVKVQTVTEGLVALFLATRQESVFMLALEAMSVKGRHGPFTCTLSLLKKMINDDEPFMISSYDLSNAWDAPRFEGVAIMLVWAWRGAKLNGETKEFVKGVRDQAIRQECHLGAAMACQLAKHFKCPNLPKKVTDALPECVALVSQRKVLEPWEKQLVQLEQFALGKKPGGANKEAKAERLIWEIMSYGTRDQLREIVPKQQLLTKGRWSRGRAVSLKRLQDEAEQLSFVSSEDMKVIRLIRGLSWPRNLCALDTFSALYAMGGHPLVFMADNLTQPIEIVRQSLKFILTENESGAVELAVQPPFESIRMNDDGIAFWWETPNRMGVLKASKEELHLTSVLSLGRGPTVIPAEGKDRLVKAVQALKDDVKVFTDVDTAGEAKVDRVDPNLTLQIHLSPWSDGLRAALLVQPLVGVDVFLPPGSGSQVLFGEVNGRPCKTQRHLSEELARVSEIVGACPSLTTNDEDDPLQWTLMEPVDCLELLTEIRALGEGLETRWPQGERFRVASEASPSQMRLKVSSSKDWFEVSGQLTVSEGQVIELQALLDLLDQDDSFGRFVKLEDGQFVALTREFRERLQELDAFTSVGKNGSRRLNPLAAHAIADLTEETQAKLTKKWIDHVERLREAADYEADLPSTLQAELRPYQLEGFQWLARLAHWGVGACLADDMGLGKTIQALGILLHRATLGPALVIAPTSVTRNWLAEVMRFAPTLRTRLFGSGDRAEALENLTGFDVVICTYGLLTIEIEKLEKITWSTIVLDEAQAIKNASTQRWKAATRLQGDFKVITSGTPIENHLGELHALFQFINPGLLGSPKSFHVKFVDPIVKERDEGARQRLKRLIRPFILRRLKNQVLKDLPPRTDIVLRVEPSKEETAFYEALRRKAIKRLTDAKEDET
ncbi:MAG: DEAD/DEAH box helicase, partial [Verrucomicrobiales bacterium]